ncbi:MAG: glycosyltransferase family 4 protein [Zhengella sp.]|uniref:glycosyltransferase family 4 protein n=1 Tax=Zhengella sp. TaxID=2282762 RepID=UPI001D86BC9C|nr:glycosyltransferase family 4 protein [Notoacmeibacter sp.]MCC0026618.1 glycosyltransferase family 4 protein [Brucellaceae bacterium]
MTDMRPLNIVHCFRSPVGGIFRHVRDLAHAQQAEGHRVGIICDSTTGGEFENRMLEALEPELALGVQRTAMQRHIGLGDITAAARTYKLINGLKPDVLHGHGAKGGVYARVFGSLLRVSRSRVARLYSPHGGSLHYDPDTNTGRFFFALEKQLSRVSDCILFVSEHERQTFLTKVGTPHCRSELIYNGLTPEEFEPVTAAPDAADFLFMGMLRLLKGPDLFLDAVLKVKRVDGSPATAVIVGDGEDRTMLVERVRAAGAQDRIRFHMPMPAREAFRLGRIMVLSSRAEALPYTVLETLAAGKIMIASRVGGIPEILGSGSPALTVPDADKLADVMQAALDDEAGFHAAMPGLDSLKARFSAQTMARQVIAVYRDILSSGARVS